MTAKELIGPATGRKLDLGEIDARLTSGANLQLMWNALVPDAQALGLDVKPWKLPPSTLEYGRKRLSSLRRSVKRRLTDKLERHARLPCTVAGAAMSADDVLVERVLDMVLVELLDAAFDTEAPINRLRQLVDLFAAKWTSLDDAYLHAELRELDAFIID